MDAYAQFLANKAKFDPPTGVSGKFELPSQLFGFQSDITRWALRRGRAALFAGTGLGKSFMELAWGQQVAIETGRPILHLAPLAVSAQMVREANKFGIPARIADPDDFQPGFINVTNYQRAHHFDFAKCGGVILDESSILKNDNGHYCRELISLCDSIPFRLAATATPAPNDFMELGTHAEFLGVMSKTDMLATFFVHDGGSTQSWRLKGHAEQEFWRWMATWAVMLRKPSDLGYPNDGYDLPPLNYKMHSVKVTENNGDGLFAMQAQTLSERISARRDSVGDRVAHAIAITPKDGPYVWWCNLNSESEALARGIEGAVETKGSDPDHIKEQKLIDFSEGRIRVLVTKPKVAGFGMNWQHCHRTGFIGLNDSWEQFYQAVRRFWRFGQTMPVDVDIIAAETEGATVANIKRKEADAERMANAMVMHMADLTAENVRGSVREKADYNPTQKIILPHWLNKGEE